MGIKTNAELKEAIQRALGGDKDSTWDIAIYKLYNYYYSMHIKRGSDEDLKNEAVFKELEESKAELHKEIEDVIDVKLKMIEQGI